MFVYAPAVMDYFLNWLQLLYLRTFDIYMQSFFNIFIFLKIIDIFLSSYMKYSLILLLQKNAPWLSVPQFGDWEQKGEVPDYSLDFSKIREMRKQNKKDVSRASIGNDEELIPSTTNEPRGTHSNDHHYHQHHSPTVRFLCLLSYLYLVSMFINIQCGPMGSSC